jgi:hypothetical protein
MLAQAVRTPDGVRALQDMAFEEYSRAVPATERSDAATQVYEKVAFWVAALYPHCGAS